MTIIELIYDADCPNIPAARAALQAAISRVSPSLTWREWDRKDPKIPGHAKPYASPTVLVDGQDVSGGAPIGGEASCRIYRDVAGKMQGSPPVEDIIAALRRRL